MKREKEKKLTLYVSLSNPLKFGVWDNLDEKRPMGWLIAKDCIDKSFEWNKLDSLSKKEIEEIEKKLREFAKNEGYRNQWRELSKIYHKLGCGKKLGIGLSFGSKYPIICGQNNFGNKTLCENCEKKNLDIIKKRKESFKKIQESKIDYF